MKSPSLKSIDSKFIFIKFQVYQETTESIFFLSVYYLLLHIHGKIPDLKYTTRNLKLTVSARQNNNTILKTNNKWAFVIFCDEIFITKVKVKTKE